MKYLFAGDIHGSVYYMKRLLKRIEQEKPDRIILLGDLLYHGPRNSLPKDYDPKTVTEMLNSLKDRAVSVRGNCDCEVDQMVLQFPIMAEYIIMECGEHVIYVTHGHTFNKKNPLPMQAGDVILCGHTHVPEISELNDYVYLNTGSVSMPKYGTRNSYVVFRNDTFVWKDVNNGRPFAQCRLN